MSLVKASVSVGLVVMLGAVALAAAQLQSEKAAPTPVAITADGIAHIPAFDVPYSTLASPESANQFQETIRSFRLMEEAPELKSGSESETTLLMRRYMDHNMYGPGLARLRRTFDVKVSSERIGGIETDVITPALGVSPKNAERVLINLHGGGFAIGARMGGQMESIPIASLGGMKVVTVDYRMWPEHKFPAASEDVANVYRALLKRYRPENIGIYGCSAGGLLTAQALAWFQQHGLPNPGAVGLFGAGATLAYGDSNYTNAALAGFPPGIKASIGYLDAPNLDLRDPLVSPAYSPKVLATFPATLLISGTRDPWMSGVIYTHAQLVKAGVDARLHIWEGALHCSFAQPIVDPNQPESKEAWNVIVKFFAAELGKARGALHSG